MNHHIPPPPPPPPFPQLGLKQQLAHVKAGYTGTPEHSFMAHVRHDIRSFDLKSRYHCCLYSIAVYTTYLVTNEVSIASIVGSQKLFIDSKLGWQKCPEQSFLKLFLQNEFIYIHYCRACLMINYCILQVTIANYLQVFFSTVLLPNYEAEKKMSQLESSYFCTYLQYSKDQPFFVHWQRR